MPIPDDKMFTKVQGPMAIARCCTHCAFVDTLRKAFPGGMGGGGRGSGFATGNRARGVMIQHFKTSHPAAYAALRVAA